MLCPFFKIVGENWRCEAAKTRENIFRVMGKGVSKFVLTKGNRCCLMYNNIMCVSPYTTPVSVTPRTQTTYNRTLYMLNGPSVKTFPKLLNCGQGCLAFNFEARWTERGVQGCGGEL